MMTPLLALLAAHSSVALAKDAPNALGAMIGTSTAFDGDPATLRLSIRPEIGLAQGSLVGANLLIPVTFSWTGEDSVGIAPGRTLVEVPLSLRIRLLPNSPVRFYGDLGTGVAFGSGWFIQEPDAAAAWMTRTALGIEIGDSDKWLVALEPASGATFVEITGEGDERAPLKARYGLMVGVTIPL